MSYKCLFSPKPDVNLKMNWSTTKKLAYAPVCCSEETFWKRSNCRRWFLVCEPAKRCFWPGLPGSTLPYWYNISMVKPQLSGVNYITVTNIYTRHQSRTQEQNSLPYLVPRWKFPLLRPNTDQSFRFNRSRDTSGSQWFRLVTKKQNKSYKFSNSEQKRPRTARLRENPMREPISKIFSKTISAKWSLNV